uniref:Regulator of chromosome condensation/beta-lactamase-inhibitor protein II n=1 Tax=Rhizophora mucronata TaxID=61149 RepID=A0A2P2P1N0_RHIMU
MIFRQRLASNLARCFSSSTGSKIKVPILYQSPEVNDENKNSATTLQVLSWGRGASGQLGGGIEEIQLYPAPVANLHVLPSSFSLSPTPGQNLLFKNEEKDKPFEVGISCGLFHSALIAEGNLWTWGKGDGGRLGFGHENPAFVPKLNPYLDSVKCVALGGIHSVALTSLGQVFTCLQGLWWFWRTGAFCLP